MKINVNALEQKRLAVFYSRDSLEAGWVNWSQVRLSFYFRLRKPRNIETRQWKTRTRYLWSHQATGKMYSNDGSTGYIQLATYLALLSKKVRKKERKKERANGNKDTQEK